MGKKMKLIPSLLMRITELNNNNNKSSSSSSSSSSSWPWPSCHQQPRTLSFRAVNSAYLDATMDMLETSESFFTVSPESASFSTTAAASDELEHSRTRGSDSVETVIRGLRSADRLFFEPEKTSSILETKAAGTATATLPPFKDSVVLSVDSRDPYVDFRKSMEEMVEAHGVKDWEHLQELLCWYLRVNDKTNHGYIVGAFVDLLVAIAFATSLSTTSSSTSTSSSSTSTSHSPSSPLSFYSSNSASSSSCRTRCVSCLEEVDAPSPSSSLLLEQVREEINLEDEVLSSSSSSNT